MTPSEFGHAVLMRAIKLVFTTKIDLDEARRLARGQILQEARAEAKRAKRKATPAASRRDDDDPGGIGARLRERIFKIIDSLETVATPSAWPAATARAGERSGARSAPDVSTPRTPAGADYSCRGQNFGCRLAPPVVRSKDRQKSRITKRVAAPASTAARPGFGAAKTYTS
jgi:hypothetical protein